MQLPTIQIGTQTYHIDFRLAEIRNTKTAKPTSFKALKSEIKAEIRGIRARTSGQYYIPGLDD